MELGRKMIFELRLGDKLGHLIHKMVLWTLLPWEKSPKFFVFKPVWHRSIKVGKGKDDGA